MGDDTNPGRGLMDMTPPEACTDKPKAVSFPWARGLGWNHYIIIGLDQLLTTRKECILTEIHDSAQLGILPEICIMVFNPRAI